MLSFTFSSLLTLLLLKKNEILNSTEKGERMSEIENEIQVNNNSHKNLKGEEERRKVEVE